MKSGSAKRTISLGAMPAIGSTGDKKDWPHRPTECLQSKAAANANHNNNTPGPSTRMTKDELFSAWSKVGSSWNKADVPLSLPEAALYVAYDLDAGQK